jgi:hypothetical protein
MEESATHWIFKAKKKAKVPVTDLIGQGKLKATRLHVLPVNTFFQLIQDIYDCLEPQYPIKEIQQSSAETPSGTPHEINDLPAAGLAALPLVIWTGTYFDDYDYDSFEVADEYAGEYEEGGATVFDS